ncbi:MAG: hypothetical protein ACPG5T_05145, partial [Endozoicomonas sp.]
FTEQNEIFRPICCHRSRTVYSRTASQESLVPKPAPIESRSRLLMNHGEIMTQRIRPAALFLLLTLSSLLTACGYHLRGKMEVPTELAQLAVSGGNHDIVHLLSRSLESTGIRITNIAPYRLRILDARQNNGQQTQASSGYYEKRLSMSILYQLETADGLPLYQPVELNRERNMTWNQNQANAGESEERIIFKELRQELIATTVRRVASISSDALEAEAERAREVQRLEQEQDNGL